MNKQEEKLIKTEKCPKGHKVKWVPFTNNRILPPHALLYCSKCGCSYLQKRAYQDSEGNWRVQLVINQIIKGKENV